MVKQPFYGLRAHLRVCWPGVICGVDLAPANVHDLHLAEELLEGFSDQALEDRNYWSPYLTEQLKGKGLHLSAPYEKSKEEEKKEWPRWLVQERRRVETVISQLVQRYRAKKTWARDRWHLTTDLNLHIGLANEERVWKGSGRPKAAATPSPRRSMPGRPRTSGR